MQLINCSESDIGRDLARRAYYNTSHSPERRGDHDIDGYLEHMQEVETEFSQWLSDDNRQELAADLEAYRAKYAELFRAYLASHANCISSFITGPSNFPTRRAEKLNRWADNHRDKWLNFSDKRLEQLRNKYNPRRVANAPISSDDPDAIDKLEAKLADLEKLQVAMVEANKIVRRKISNEEKVTAMVTELGWKESTARKALEPDYIGKVGFPAYQLQNNNANIRRIKERIEELRRKANDTTTEADLGNGVQVVDNVEANRVQLFFPGKPAANVIAKLKSRGFHWTPSIKAWQRQRNPYALQLAKEIAAEYEE